MGVSGISIGLLHPESGLWRLYQPLPAVVNAYLVEDGVGLTLVDTGVGLKSGAMLRAVEAVEGRTGKRLERVALTHAHFDHAGNLAEIVAARGVPVHLHPEEAPFVTGARSYAELPGLRISMAMHGQLYRKCPDATLRPLSDGESLGPLTALHTPGHTPGHLSFYHEPSRIWLAGDVIASLGGWVHGPPWPFTWDRALCRRSAQRLLERPFVAISSGHHAGPVQRHAEERLRAYLRRVGQD